MLRPITATLLFVPGRTRWALTPLNSEFINREEGGSFSPEVDSLGSSRVRDLGALGGGFRAALSEATAASSSPTLAARPNFAPTFASSAKNATTPSIATACAR